MNLALPYELNSEARTRLVRRFVEDAFVNRGMVADVAIHHPDRHGNERNHHAHIMLTMRELDGGNFAAKKQRDWNTEQTLQDWRALWADYQNDALEEAGSLERVDHRSYERQGIDRMPAFHLGYEASAMERRGMPTRIGDDNREIVAHNDNVARLAEELADLDARIAEEMQREILAQKRNDTSQMTREAWETYKRRMQSPFNEMAEAHRALLQRGAWEKLTRDMIDADEWERSRGQDGHRERGGREEPDPEPDV